MYKTGLLTVPRTLCHHVLPTWRRVSWRHKSNEAAGLNIIQIMSLEKILGNSCCKFERMCDPHPQVTFSSLHLVFLLLSLLFTAISIWNIWLFELLSFYIVMQCFQPYNYLFTFAVHNSVQWLVIFLFDDNIIWLITAHICLQVYILHLHFAGRFSLVRRSV